MTRMTKAMIFKILKINQQQPQIDTQPTDKALTQIGI